MMRISYERVNGVRVENAAVSEIKLDAKIGAITPETIIDVDEKHVPARKIRELAAIFAEKVSKIDATFQTVSPTERFQEKKSAIKKVDLTKSSSDVANREELRSVSRRTDDDSIYILLANGRKKRTDLAQLLRNASTGGIRPETILLYRQTTVAAREIREIAKVFEEREQRRNEKQALRVDRRKIASEASETWR